MSRLFFPLSKGIPQEGHAEPLTIPDDSTNARICAKSAMKNQNQGKLFYLKENKFKFILN